MSCVTSLIIFGLSVISLLGDNCPYKECYCSEGVISCDGLNLKEVPQKMFQTNPLLSSLDFDENQITTILAGSLPANLSSFSIRDNPIKTIDDAAFDESIYTLEELTFSQAGFTQIPEAVFRLKHLRNLDIFETNILVWNDEAMKLLAPAMQILSLDTVGLTTWPTWIKSMANLTELTISGSYISFIPDDALDMVADTLDRLILTKNNLTTLPKSLGNMTALRSLSLDYNRISDLTWLPQLSHLFTLSLTNNKITDAQQLSSVLKPHADTLYDFQIHDNSLTSFPELSFMSEIGTLDFTFNHISDSISGSVPSFLVELKMDNNFLTSIPRIIHMSKHVPVLDLNSNDIRTLQGNEFPASTTIADLAYNLISQLTSSSFPENSSITIITLNNNPISSVSLDAFKYLFKLKELNLQNTKLTRLPLAILSLTNLFYLDVTGNTELVCTCQEKGLQTRIQKFGPNMVVGNCGQSSVYFFFAELSPKCPPT